MDMQGSPPHLRGKPNFGDYLKAEARITPAPAGKTICSSRQALTAQDHPRTCGENSKRICADTRDTGSPPHLRGKLKSLRGTSLMHRITPAPAGKTVGIDGELLAGRDHPRTCGENKLIPFVSLFKIGSPPHLRGKPRSKPLTGKASGITPAPAGKTKFYHYMGERAKDHPRTCGENTKK